MMSNLVNEAWYAVKCNGSWFAGRYYADYNEFYDDASIPIAYANECDNIVLLEDGGPT